MYPVKRTVLFVTSCRWIVIIDSHRWLLKAQKRGRLRLRAECLRRAGVLETKLSSSYDFTYERASTI